MLDLLASLFADMAAAMAGGSIARRIQTVEDKRRVTGGQTRSAIRAVTGRVNNIGTEWSEGVAEFGPGHIRFVPRIGIVGDRELRVISLKPTQATDLEVPNPGAYAYYLFATEHGELYWAIPEKFADEIIAAVVPDSAPPHPTRP